MLQQRKKKHITRNQASVATQAALLSSRQETPVSRQRWMYSLSKWTLQRSQQHKPHARRTRLEGILRIVYVVLHERMLHVRVYHVHFDTHTTTRLE